METGEAGTVALIAILANLTTTLMLIAITITKITTTIMT
jgi:hypothetical protein